MGGIPGRVRGQGRPGHRWPGQATTGTSARSEGRERRGGGAIIGRTAHRRLNCWRMGHQPLVLGGRARSLIVTGLIVGLLAIPACAETGGPHAKGALSISTTPGCPLSKSFSDSYLKFYYPTCWNAVSYSEFETFSTPVVDLSNQVTHNPCKTVGIRTSCGWPVAELAPAHVLVLWAANGEPGWTLNRAAGATTTVGVDRHERRSPDLGHVDSYEEMRRSPLPFPNQA